MTSLLPFFPLPLELQLAEVMAEAADTGEIRARAPVPCGWRWFSPTGAPAGGIAWAWPFGRDDMSHAGCSSAWWRLLLTVALELVCADMASSPLDFF